LKTLKEHLKPTNPQPSRQFYDRFISELTDAEQVALAHFLDAVIKGEDQEVILATRSQDEQALIKRVLARLEAETPP
jgi:uncharacterized protein YeaO (DUF488 family)